MLLHQNNECNQFVMLNMDTTDIINIKAMADMVKDATMYQYGGYMSDLCATSLTDEVCIFIIFFYKLSFTTGLLILWGRLG